MHAQARLVSLALVLALVGCGSDSGGGSGPSTCVPGQSIACAGAGGCSGAQICKADGTYDVCVCGAGDGGAGADTSIDAGDKDVGADTALVVDSAIESGSDATDAADGAIAPITPDKLTGLSLWLDGDKDVTANSTGEVTLWKDQSGQANDAKSLFTTARPTWNKSAIKGHDALRFHSACPYLTVLDDPTLQFGTGPFMIVAVSAWDSGYQGSVIFLKDLPDPGAVLGGLHLNYTGAVGIDAHVSALTPTADAFDGFSNTNFHAVIVRGPALQIRMDGVAVTGKTNTTDLSAVGKDVHIGGPVASMTSGGSANCGQMDVAELVVVKGAVTDAQVDGLELYLKTRYKFTW